MLVMTRRIGEKIIIGSDISVAILGVTASHVRIGVDAPREVDVHREEVFNRIHSDLVPTEVTHSK